MTSAPHVPAIHVSDAAGKALRQVVADAGEASLRLVISARFEHGFSFGPPVEGDIAVDAGGITVLLDPASARRADGLSIDVVEAPAGLEFTVRNPNEQRASRPIELRRDCQATLIPHGGKVTLARGESVVLVQALGGSFTVRTDAGALVRIAGRDADALGLEPTATEAAPPGDGPFELERVIAQLRTVFDPEIPVNVVDLGLVYGCEAHPLPGGGYRVEIRMSMTAPGCGMGHVLQEDARAKVRAVPGVAEVDVQIVWDPPWDPGRMSEAARLQLGML